MKSLGILFGLGLVSALPASALACTFPLPDPVAGESDASYSQRTQSFIREWQANGSKAWQRLLFDDASRITLARVIARRGTGGMNFDSLRAPPVDTPPTYSADLQPIAALKGDLPPGPVTVNWQHEMQCRFFEPGSAARSLVSTVVILFDGFPTGSYFTAPDALPASMARDPRLLSALKRHPEAMPK
nr:hypothetical protein [uncultured Sphingomonas sp.]